MQDSDAWRIHVGWADLDPVAVAAIVVLTALICISTRESGRFNTTLVLIKLTGVLFVIIVGVLRSPPLHCAFRHALSTCSAHHARRK